MSAARVSVERLRRELALRGWNGVDLAYFAKVSPATVSAAMQGRSVSTTTIRKMAIALSKQPVIEGAADLLG